MASLRLCSERARAEQTPAAPPLDRQPRNESFQFQPWAVSARPVPMGVCVPPAPTEAAKKPHKGMRLFRQKICQRKIVCIPKRSATYTLLKGVFTSDAPVTRLSKTMTRRRVAMTYRTED